MTTEIAKSVTTCRVCGAADWQEVISFGSVPLANAYLDKPGPEEAYPLELISCRSCRLLSLTAVVDPQALYRDYAYVTSESETMTHHMRDVVRLCRERIDAGGLVVELGSNTGNQLQLFQQAGHPVLGVDPAQNLAAIAERRGVPTVADYFNEKVATAIAGEHGRASLILGRHVFAHIDDLADVLRGVKALLTDDGLFAIEVPYACDLLERVAFDTIYHEHLSYFLISTLDRLFTRHGLRAIDVRRLAVHGGSVLVTAARMGSRWETDERVGELIAYEKSERLDTDARYEQFAARVHALRRELTELVRKEAANGKRVAGYGASAKGTTLLNICELTSTEVRFCTDTTPQKQGRFVPGTQIPIVAPGDVSEQPDLYLLLAWNYAEEILQREAAFLDAGGAFIIPVPEPAVYARQKVRQ
uniref:SibM n=1 Tax=Streptosporangium sibiricum TaxID=457432 RepID=C0LTM7_STRSJ|nr:SibM [Streptosporangium sibiricum]